MGSPYGDTLGILGALTGPRLCILPFHLVELDACALLECTAAPHLFLHPRAEVVALAHPLSFLAFRTALEMTRELIWPNPQLSFVSDVTPGFSIAAPKAALRQSRALDSHLPR